MKTLAILSATLLLIAACGSGSSSPSSTADGGHPVTSPGDDASMAVGADDGSVTTSSVDGAATGGGGDATSTSTDASGAEAGAVAAMANPAPGTKFFVGTNFWNIDWEGQGDFFVDNVDFTTTTNPWKPALLSDLAPYCAMLRFMDWNQGPTTSNNAPGRLEHAQTENAGAERARGASEVARS